MKLTKPERMKADLCEGVDALYMIVNEIKPDDPHAELKKAAAASLGILAARFCAGVDMVSKGDLEYMQAIVGEMQEFCENNSCDDDCDDCTCKTDPEMN